MGEVLEELGLAFRAGEVVFPAQQVAFLYRDALYLNLLEILIPPLKD